MAAKRRRKKKKARSLFTHCCRVVCIKISKMRQQSKAAKMSTKATVLLCYSIISFRGLQCAFALGPIFFFFFWFVHGEIVWLSCRRQQVRIWQLHCSSRRKREGDSNVSPWGVQDRSGSLQTRHQCTFCGICRGKVV